MIIHGDGTGLNSDISSWCPATGAGTDHAVREVDLLRSDVDCRWCGRGSPAADRRADGAVV